MLEPDLRSCIEWRVVVALPGEGFVREPHSNTYSPHLK
jgi:hypothetical protein